MFKQSCSNIDVLADDVSCYVSFCEDNVIPEKTVKVYPNSKPWVTKALRALLYRKRQAFIAGNLPEVEKLKKEVKHEIARAKRSYQEKLEEQLVNNNLGSAWDSMKTIIGTKKTRNPNLVLDGFTCDRKLAQTLNEFYLRFDSPTFKDAILEQKNYLKDSAPAPFDLHDVVDTFRHSKVKKSPGPDNIGGHLLSSCAEQLGLIFYYIFKLSLSQQRVPKIWKNSTIVPVAKISRPKVLNDFRPIALTSLVMKCFEKLMKKVLLIKTENLLDPQQFAYRARRGVEDATATLLNLILKHLEGSNTHAKFLFVDFSSAFNTIQPHILVDKLLRNFNLDFSLVGWIWDFLTDRTQRVRVNGVYSEKLLSSTGSPQGCVLSPLLYILYTDDCRSQHTNRHILKFADDSAIVSL